MWSHYADSHKGFCIEYDLTKVDFNKNQFVLFPVKYSHKRPPIPWTSMLNNNETSINKKVLYDIIMSVLTKDDIWSYENEWRFINLSKVNPHFIEFPYA